MYSMVHHSKRRNSKRGRLLTTVQQKCYNEKPRSLEAEKVRPGFSLRRIGWAEGGAEGRAGGVRAAVVAERTWTCGAAAMGLL